MTILNRIASAALVAAALTAASPSSAVITTFATFSPATATRNLLWTKVGTNGGTLMSISTGSAATFGTAKVKFSFLQPALSPYVTGAKALFSLNATTTAGNPASLSGGFLSQEVTSGSFSFTSIANITIGTHFFAAGSNLLSGVFTSGTIAGGVGATSGGVSGSTSGGDIITFTSDFLNFSSTINRDWALAFTAANPVLFRTTPTSSLRTFRATTGGNFSSDPAPLTFVPEPGVWGMLIAGFGLVGVQMRRRGRRTVAA